MSDQKIDVQFNQGDLTELDHAAHVDGAVNFFHNNDSLSISLDYKENNINKRALLKAPTIQLTTAQLTASTWSNGRYSFESLYPASSYNLAISPAETITDAQLNAMAKARLISDDTENTLIARGTVPSVNIPIQLEVTSK